MQLWCSHGRVSTTVTDRCVASTSARARPCPPVSGIFRRSNDRTAYSKRFQLGVGEGSISHPNRGFFFVFRASTFEQNGRGPTLPSLPLPVSDIVVRLGRFRPPAPILLLHHLRFSSFATVILLASRLV